MLRSMSVLYVEDDAGSREIILDMLTRRMVSVVVAGNGEEGLAAFWRVMPDIVITDIQMPRMNGLDMAAAIKQFSPNTPIIVTTAFNNNEFLLKAIAAGIDKFLLKPVERAGLEEALIQCARPLALEKQLRESEEKFRLIAENVDDLITLVDSGGKRIYNSPSYLKVLGKMPKCGTSSFQEIHPDDRERVHKIFLETVSSGIGRQTEYRIQRDDGSVRYIESNASIIADNGGKAAKVVVVSRDITERHLADEELAASHQRFLTVLDGMDALVYVADMQTYEVLFANRYAREAIGTELLGKVCWQTLQADQAGPCSFCTNNRLLTPEGAPAEACVWEFQNTVNQRWYLIRDHAIQWTDGRIVRMEIATDITFLKEIEEALRRSEMSLSRAQSMAHVGSWDWRIAEGVVSYSEETARIAGLAFPAGECTIEEFLKPVCAGDKLTVLRAINAALFEGKPYDFDFCIERGKGEIRHVRHLAEVERDAAGRPTRMIGAIQDITESRNLEKTILEISEQVRREIGQELHDELGQQLTGIGFASKVLEGKLAGLSLAESQDASRIVQAVTHAISQTRALAKGLYPVDLEENGLRTALEQLSINACNTFGVECTFQLSQGVVSLKQGVAIHLYRIAQEAVSNAIKHGNASRITISLLPVENKFDLRIADNGAGLEPSLLPHSSGMGLRIMEYRARLIGALLHIQKMPQGGTIVTVH